MNLPHVIEHWRLVVDMEAQKSYRRSRWKPTDSFPSWSYDKKVVKVSNFRFQELRCVFALDLFREGAS
jgi:hypothetical protein